MGKKKLTIIDDSLPVEEKTSGKDKERVKSESVEAIGAAEPTPEVNESTSEEGAKQTNSEQTGSASGASRPDEQAPKKKAQKPGKTHGSASKKVRSKKYQEKVAELDRTKALPVTEAIDLVKKLSYSKFDGTLEAHINTIQTGMRGLVSLPFASGKKLTILAFGKGAEESGADIVGTEEVVETINKGKVSFDLVVTTPEWMPKLAKIARILGPRGLMPNPKNGTITDDLKKAVEGFQAGKTEYKTESKAPVIHLGLGKLTQPNEELVANIKILIQTLGKTRVRKVTLAPTMGPSVRVELASL